MSVYLIFVNSFAVLCACFAGIRGGAPERVVAFAYSLWVLAGPIYKTWGDPHFDRLDPINLAIDGGLMLVLVIVALKANRVWPMLAAAFALLPMMGHFARGVNLDGMQRAYWAMTEPAPLAIAIILATGAFLHTKRQESRGEYRDWRLVTVP
jgi:hypothetical protein